MTIETRIDWLSCAFDGQTIPSVVFPELDWRLDGKGKHSYAVQMRDNLTGAIAQCDNEAGKSSLLVSFGGEAIQNLWKTPGWMSRWQTKLLSTPIVRGAHFTRIDVAVDFKGELITPLMLWTCLNNGQASSATKTNFFGTGQKDGTRRGDTLYLGSRQSPLFMRWYDKAAQLDLSRGTEWTRGEVEVKGAQADNVARLIVEDELLPVARTLFARMLVWRNDTYARFLAGTWANLTPVPRKEPKTEKWLRTDVSRTYARVTRDNPSFEQKWVEAVGIARRVLDKGE